VRWYAKSKYKHRMKRRGMVDITKGREMLLIINTGDERIVVSGGVRDDGAIDCFGEEERNVSLTGMINGVEVTTSGLTESLVERVRDRYKDDNETTL